MIYCDVEYPYRNGRLHSDYAIVSNAKSSVVSSKYSLLDSKHI